MGKFFKASSYLKGSCTSQEIHQRVYEQWGYIVTTGLIGRSLCTLESQNEKFGHWVVLSLQMFAGLWCLLWNRMQMWSKKLMSTLRSYFIFSNRWAVSGCSSLPTDRRRGGGGRTCIQPQVEKELGFYQGRRLEPSQPGPRLPGAQRLHGPDPGRWAGQHHPDWGGSIIWVIEMD